jgi:hypothetical protein
VGSNCTNQAQARHPKEWLVALNDSSIGIQGIGAEKDLKVSEHVSNYEAHKH